MKRFSFVWSLTVAFFLVFPVISSLETLSSIQNSSPPFAPQSSLRKTEDAQALGAEAFGNRNFTSQRLEEEIVHANCLRRCPSGAAPDNKRVDHEIILLSLNKKTKFADWVAYKIKADDLKGPERPRNWKKDPHVSDQLTLIPSDYRPLSKEPYSFDRGHQAPLASFKNHPKWYRLNYLSNITPQKKYLNRGPWKRLESKEREMARTSSEVYVLTGPYYHRDRHMRGPSSKRINYLIPSGYWKMISLKKENKIKTIGFMFSQETGSHASLCHHVVPIAKIEDMSGLKFFNDPLFVEEGGLLEQVGCP